jgi:hypothetical protein
VPPPRFDPDAETWQDICPWCGHWETFQVGTETPLKVVMWCRSCSGSSWLYRAADFLVPRTAPKKLHDKRRINGARPPKQTEPVMRPPSGNGRRALR